MACGAALRVPLVVEGRLSRPEEAARAISRGAFAGVVGTAIARPERIGRRAHLEAYTSAAVLPRYGAGAQAGSCLKCTSFCSTSSSSAGGSSPSMNRSSLYPEPSRTTPT